jgi:hypothetical protein
VPAASGPLALAPPAKLWAQSLPKSQDDLERLGQAAQDLEGQLGSLGPGSPLIEIIALSQSFVLAQNLIAYPPAQPDLGQLVNRPKFRAEILESLSLARQKSLDSIFPAPASGAGR